MPAGKAATLEGLGGSHRHDGQMTLGPAEERQACAYREEGALDVYSH